MKEKFKQNINRFFTKNKKIADNEIRDKDKILNIKNLTFGDFLIFFMKTFKFFVKIILGVFLVTFCLFFIFIFVLLSYRIYMHLNINLNKDKIYSSQNDKYIAKTIESAFKTNSLDSERVHLLKSYTQEFNFEDTKCICISVGRYSTQTKDILDNLKVDYKYAHTLEYKKRLEGDSLLLIVGKNNQILPIIFYMNDAEIMDESKFENDDIDKPDCIYKNNFTITVKSQKDKENEIFIK